MRPNVFQNWSGPKTLKRQGTGCHKGSQKLLKDRVQGVTKTLNAQGGVTQNVLDHEIWVLSYPFHSHRLSLNITK